MISTHMLRIVLVQAFVAVILIFSASTYNSLSYEREVYGAKAERSEEVNVVVKEVTNPNPIHSPMFDINMEDLNFKANFSEDVNAAAHRALQRAKVYSKIFDPLQNERKNNSILNKFIVSPFFVTARLIPSPTAITACTTLTIDRIPRLLAWAKRWPSPISAAIWIQAQNIDHIMDLRGLASKLKDYPNIDIHIVVNPHNRSVLYPNNGLRQVTAECARTKYVLTIDTDFLPAPNLDLNLQKYAKTFLPSDGARVPTSNSSEDDNVALVIISWEMLFNSTQLDWTKDEVIKRWKNKEARQFHIHNYRIGHDDTDYKRWSEANSPYFINPRHGYEPYTLLVKPFPSFDEEFDNGWFDKVSHISELIEAKYKFLVIPNEFILHFPHPHIRKAVEVMPAKRHYADFVERVKTSPPKEQRDFVMTAYVHPGLLSSMQASLSDANWKVISDSKICEVNLDDKSYQGCSLRQHVFFKGGKEMPEYNAVIFSSMGEMEGKITKESSCFARVTLYTESLRLETRILHFDESMSKLHTLINLKTHSRLLKVDIVLGVTKPEANIKCKFYNLSLSILPSKLPELRITPNYFVGKDVFELEISAAKTLTVAARMEDLQAYDHQLSYDNWRTVPISLVLHSTSGNVSKLMTGINDILKRRRKVISDQAEHRNGYTALGWLDRARVHIVSHSSAVQEKELLEIACKYSGTGNCV